MAKSPALKKRPRPRKKKVTLVPKATIDAALAELDSIPATTPKAARLRALFRSWLKDESGYDEETWPELKKALDQERRRAGARRLFDD